MATLTLKNFPDALYAELKTRAAQHRRSLNQQAILCLEQALATTPSPEVVARRLADLKKSRSRLTGIYLTDEDIAAARSAGRR